MTCDLVVSDVRLFDGRAVDIGVNGSKIAALAAAGSLSGKKHVSGGGGLCTRPLSDSHLHLDKSGTVSAYSKPPSSLAEAISLMGTIKRAAKENPSGMTDRIVKTLLSLHRNGTRFIRAVVDVDETWGLAGFDAALAARKKIGDMLEIQIVAFAQEGMTGKVAEMLTEAAGRGAEAIGAHTDIENDPTNHIKTAARIAREGRLPLEVHVDEPAKQDHFRLPLVLDYAGDIAGLTLVHCLSLGKQPVAEQDRWIQRIKEVGASVVIAPSVLIFGLPLAPVEKLLEAGIPVGIGSDNLQDVFVPFGTGRLLESVRIAVFATQLSRPNWMNALLHGATGVGFSLVTNDPQNIETNSTATFSVFEGASPTAVLFGQDSIRLVVIKGEVKEQVTQ